MSQILSCFRQFIDNEKVTYMMKAYKEDNNMKDHLPFKNYHCDDWKGNYLN